MRITSVGGGVAEVMDVMRNEGSGFALIKLRHYVCEGLYNESVTNAILGSVIWCGSGYRPVSHPNLLGICHRHRSGGGN